MNMSRKSSHTSRKPGRKPLTRDMLLPLPVAETRPISLENHLALVAMRGGHGNADLMICLLKAVYLSYFLHEAAYGRTGLDPFREAEAVLQHSVTRAERNEGWWIPQADSAILEAILTLYDGQLASMPAHVLAAARARLQRYLASDLISPIPPRQKQKAVSQPAGENSFV